MPGVPVIYDGNDPDAAEVIRARAEELGSPAYEVKRSDTEVLRILRRELILHFGMSIIRIWFSPFRLLQSIR